MIAKTLNLPLTYGALLLLSLLVTSCGDAVKKPGSLADRQNNADLVALGGANECLKCHRINASIIGPAWDLVAKRYQNNPDAREMLINKVKTGGSGNWNNITGGAVMPPNSPRVADADVEKLVDLILAIK